jgi:hypothetical protein
VLRVSALAALTCRKEGEHSYQYEDDASPEQAVATVVLVGDGDAADEGHGPPCPADVVPWIDSVHGSRMVLASPWVLKRSFRPGPLVDDAVGAHEARTAVVALSQRSWGTPTTAGLFSRWCCCLRYSERPVSESQFAFRASTYSEPIRRDSVSGGSTFSQLWPNSCCCASANPATRSSRTRVSESNMLMWRSL